MNAIKERIFGAITVMNDSDAEKVWNFVIENLSPKSWEDIEEVTPDEWDLEMIERAKMVNDGHGVPIETLASELGVKL